MIYLIISKLTENELKEIKSMLTFICLLYEGKKIKKEELVCEERKHFPYQRFVGIKNTPLDASTIQRFDSFLRHWRREEMRLTYKKVNDVEYELEKRFYCVVKSLIEEKLLDDRIISEDSELYALNKVLNDLYPDGKLNRIFIDYLKQNNLTTNVLDVKFDNSLMTAYEALKDVVDSRIKEICLKELRDNALFWTRMRRKQFEMSKLKKGHSRN